MPICREKNLESTRTKIIKMKTTSVFTNDISNNLFLQVFPVQVLQLYSKKKMLIVAKLTYEESFSYANICVELINSWKLSQHLFLTF